MGVGFRVYQFVHSAAFIVFVHTWDRVLSYRFLNSSFPHPNIAFLNVIKRKGGMQGNKDRRTTVPRDAGLGRGTKDEHKNRGT
jgi:hypothetical protein